MDANSLLAQATRHHTAGQLAEAQQLYQQILACEPANFHALYQGGTLALQAGQFHDAIRLLSDAVRLQGGASAPHANLAEAYRRAGDLPNATAAAMQAIKLDARMVSAHNILAHIRYQQRDFQSAADSFRLAADLLPDDVRLQLQLGQTLVEAGQFAEAEQVFRRATNLDPNNPRAYANLGYLLHRSNHFDDAIECYQKVVALTPGDADALNNLGVLYQTRADFSRAEDHFRRAIEANPGFGPAYCNLGATLVERGDPAAGLDYIRRSAELDPGSDSSHYNLGYAFYRANRFDEAIDYLRRAIEFNPRQALAYGNLGNCYRNLGRMTEAIDAYRKSVELAPTMAETHSNLLFALHSRPEYDPQTIFAEHLRWAQRHADPLQNQATPHPNLRTLDRRLRVGYVSAHFYSQAVNFFSEPILQNHDRSAFEVFCYSDVRKPDFVTDRLRSYDSQWRDIAFYNDQAVSEMIRQDKIDILVDLAGHIGGNRLLAFARRPAPVQVTYIGYQNTTGMQAMDYRLTDDWSDPPGETDGLHTEKLVRLPQTFFCYRTTPEIPLVPEQPLVRNGYITFGSFNHFAKVTPEVLAAWAKILCSVPHSRLVIVTMLVESVQRQTLAVLQANGLGPDRVDFVDRCPYNEYLNHISKVDIALDPFPFNGHTTTCDTLWMGVPVVMMAGRTYVARYGSSALVNLGLDALIATNEDEYRAIALRLAGQPDQLRIWRQELRAQMATSAMCDPVGFTRTLENTYRQMWSTWCQSK